MALYAGLTDRSPTPVNSAVDDINRTLPIVNALVLLKVIEERKTGAASNIPVPANVALADKTGLAVKVDVPLNRADAGPE